MRRVQLARRRISITHCRPSTRLADRLRAPAEGEERERRARQPRAGATRLCGAAPLLHRLGHIDALSIVSNRPGGFTGSDLLDRLYLLHFAFTRIVKTRSLRDTTSNLLDAMSDALPASASWPAK